MFWIIFYFIKGINNFASCLFYWLVVISYLILKFTFLHINQSHSNIWLTILVLRSLKRFTHNRLDEVFFKYARMQSVYLQMIKDVHMQLHFCFYVWRLKTWKCHLHRNTIVKDEWSGLNFNSIWIFATFPAASKAHSILWLDLQFSFHLNNVYVDPLKKLHCQIWSHIFETTFVLITIEIQKPNADIFCPRVHLNGKP